MSEVTRFRRHLIRRIALAAGVAALPVGCGDESNGTSGSGDTMATGPYYGTETQCFLWPQSNVGGAGGSGGMVSIGGAGGVGGAGGLSGVGGAIGGAGGAAVAPCPSKTEAGTYLDVLGGCGTSSIDSDGTFDGAQCCYQVTVQYCVGRPFIVSGAARASEPRWGREAWSDALWTKPRLEGLTAQERRALADQWCRDGMLEHASVASFGRFALELMAVGAPAALVRGAHAAALDEVRHASACLALASAYAGEAVRPSPFPFDGPLEVSADLVDVATRVILEGCIGETVAALQANQQHANASDAAVRDVLAMIARDELRHAELAWRTVAWALSVDSSRAMRMALERALELGCEAIAASPTHAHLEHRPQLAAHGRLDDTTIRRLRRTAMTEVVRPNAVAMWARKPTLEALAVSG